MQISVSEFAELLKVVEAQAKEAYAQGREDERQVQQTQPVHAVPPNPPRETVSDSGVQR